MSQMKIIANSFFEACETGKGWSACKEFCHENASFSSHADPLLEIKTIEEYSDWMIGICQIMPDSKYEIRSVTIDEDSGHISFFAVFSGTHSKDGGPVSPTGKWGQVDYVYALEFKNEKISHLTKIWNPHFMFKQIGWE